MNIICVISQPTFLPWLGWFDLVDQADVMVILDDVQFSKQSWQQRNRIRTSKGLEYLSVPVKTSGRMGQQLLECELADKRFIEKMLRTIQGSYAGALYFRDMFPDFEMTLRDAGSSGLLVDFNCALINWMSRKIGIETRIIRASDLKIEGRRGEHVAGICSHLGADNYLSTAGAAGYLRDDVAAFDARGIRIWIHQYEHPAYSQVRSPFLPFACTLDLIFNEGDKALEIIRSGRRPPILLEESECHGN